MTKIKSAQEWAKDIQSLRLPRSDESIAALIRKAQSEAWEAGREAAAQESLRIWKEAPNDRASRWRQNELGNGCAASAEAIRALPNPFKESKGDE